MAIRRCPYCKAIIDETDKYCNNCGTQLLFPEDESIEEEIPGDKIIEEREEEEEEEEEEQEEQEEDELEGLQEQGEEEEEEEWEKEEWKEEEEVKEEEEPDKKYEVALEDDELIFKTKKLERLTSEEEVDELEGIGEAEGEEGKEAEPRESKEETGDELPPWASEMKQGRATASRREEERGTEEGTEEGEEEKGGKKGEVETEGIKVAEPGEAREEEEEKTEEGREEKAAGEEEEKEEGEEGLGQRTPEPGLTPPSRWTQDSGIGVPENITQSGLLFGDTGRAEEGTADDLARRAIMPSDEEEEVVAGEETSETPAATGLEEKARLRAGETQAGGEAIPIRQPGFFLKIKSKLVDLVFITAIWLISLWFAARVIEVSFFRLLTKSPLPALGFYLILLTLYFFLFLYFLGETLGDHYFSEEE